MLPEGLGFYSSECFSKVSWTVVFGGCNLFSCLQTHKESKPPETQNPQIKQVRPKLAVHP